jgi:DNA-binding NarL/FixJ family response regulator
MHDARSQDPDPKRLLDYTGQVHHLLQGWCLLIATAHRGYADLLSLHLQELQPNPPLLPQRLLAVCDSCHALREHLPADTANVLLLTEVSLKNGSVLPLLQELRQRVNPPRILVAMAEPLQAALARAAWRLGVDALVCTSHYGSGELVRALEAVAQQQRYWGPAFAGLLDDVGPVSDALSQRELEVMPLLAQGLTNKQIAARLQITEVTARDHVQRIIQKLQVSDRTAAAAMAVRLGLVP